MDNSFLKLYKNDFAAAVMNDNIAAYGTKYTGFAQQLPTETFMQITNCEEDIAFAGNLLVELIDLCGEVVQDITDKFFYTEITDIFGVRQIKYEFGMIGVDYGQELLFLKLTHTVSEKTWYSAGFFITDNNEKETDIFHYGNTSYFRGISYDKFDNIIFAPQIIRLQCFRGDGDIDKDGEETIQDSGNKSAGRSTLTPMEKHIFYICDFFTHKRLVTMLNHQIIYMNGFRIGGKPMVEKGERWEDSNAFDCAFTANVTEEKLPEIVRLFQFLDLVQRSPEGNYTQASLPGEIVGTFNKDVVFGSGTVKLFSQADGLLATYTAADITIVGSQFTIDISALGLGDGSYYIKIDDGAFLSGAEIFGGIDDDETWKFRVSNGDYKASDYKPSDYSIYS